MKHLSKLLALALCLALLGTLAVPAMAEEDITSWILEENPESISGTVRWWMPFTRQGSPASWSFTSRPAPRP